MAAMEGTGICHCRLQHSTGTPGRDKFSHKSAYLQVPESLEGKAWLIDPVFLHDPHCIGLAVVGKSLNGPHDIPCGRIQHFTVFDFHQTACLSTETDPLSSCQYLPVIHDPGTVCLLPYLCRWQQPHCQQVLLLLNSLILLGNQDILGVWTDHRPIFHTVLGLVQIFPHEQVCIQQRPRAGPEGIIAGQDTCPSICRLRLCLHQQGRPLAVEVVPAGNPLGMPCIPAVCQYHPAAPVYQLHPARPIRPGA